MFIRIPPVLSAILVAALLAGCSASSEPPAAEGADAATQAPLVSVMTLEAKSVTVWDELPGRVSAFRTAEIRPQVSGLIIARSFEEGSDVTQGQSLFQIDTASFAADVASAEAALQKSRAVLAQAAAEFDRSDVLRQSNNISDQSFDQIASQHAQAAADVAQAEAALKKARLSLDLATVKAPIDGQIGAATAGEGSLAEATSTTSLATIQQIGKVHIDIRQPASRLEHLRAMARTGGLQQAGAIPIEILLGDGDDNIIAARALFSDISVDEGTGNVRLRAVADNAGRRLLPGMYVRARVPRGIYPDAIGVPQQAVVRDALGVASVYVVDADGNAAAKPVQLGELVEGKYIIRDGLKTGDRIVVEGQEKLAAPGAVRTVEFGAKPADTASPAQND
ncbi:efflux RND transporter periplasmic adaptor subunit [Devosia sp.]|uniref:efflux RND transporter periplasmic adaptor subunit n=1 Tax=Devosia sp. TaxID=1871048 RepID=UPI002FC903F4